MARALIACLLVLLTTASVVKARMVSVELEAPWPRTVHSVLSEVAEFVGEFSDTAYWAFMDDLCVNSANVEAALSLDPTDARGELEGIAFAAANSALPATLHALMDLSMGMGAYTPASQYYNTIYAGVAAQTQAKCSTAFLVNVNGKVFCNADDLTVSRYPSNETAILLSDHVRRSSGPKPLVFLYGVPGTHAFCTLFGALQAQHAIEELSFVVRYAYPNTSSTKSTQLRGFGVILDIKNMEYKTIDDSNAIASQETDEYIPPAEEVLGFNLAAIAARRPQLVKEIRLFHDELASLLEDDLPSSTEPMKVWKMKDLGLQTVHLMNQARDQVKGDLPAILKLADIVHNFPSYASKLSNIKLKGSFRAGMSMWQEYGLQNALPSNTLFINGAQIPLAGATFNLFDVLSLVRREIKSLAPLHALELSEDLSEAVLRAAIAAGAFSSSKKSVRIDVSKGAKYVAHFINNLEKDPQYRRWSKSLQQLMFPSWSIVPVARNLYTVIAVTDALSMDGAAILNDVHMLYQQQYPLRFALIPWCESNVTAPPGQRSGSDYATPSDVCRLFQHAKQRSTQTKATDFLLSLASEVFSAAATYGQAPQFTLYEISAIALTTMLDKSPKPSEVSALISTISTLHDDFIRNVTHYIDSHGLEANSFTMNGIYKKAEGGAFQEGSVLSKSIMNFLGREQYMIQQMIGSHAISDKTQSLFNAILDANENTYLRYHPLLDEGVSPVYIDSVSVAGSSLIRSFSLPDIGGFIEQAGDKDTLIVSAPISYTGLTSAANAIDWLLSESEEKASNARLGFVWQFESSDENAQVEITASEVSASTSNANIVVFLMAAQDYHRSNSDLFTLKQFSEVLRALSYSCEGAWDGVLNHLPDLRDAIPAIHDRALANREAYLKLAKQRVHWLRGIVEDDMDPQSEVLAVFNARIAVLSLASSPSKPVHTLDFALLAKVESNRLGALIHSACREAGVDLSANTLLDVFSFAGRYSSSSKSKGEGSKLGAGRVDVRQVIRNHGMDLDRLLAADSETKPFLYSLQAHSSGNIGIEAVFIVDPLSVAGQRAAAVIPIINQLPVSQLIILTPSEAVHEFPLQNYYRWVGTEQGRPGAWFGSLPKQHVLTVRVDVPEAWNIQASQAIQDIDNLRCDSTLCGDGPLNSENGRTTRVVYELKNLLIAGQCYETAYTPPTGLQLVLRSGRLASDTLVMGNLGYFQLQANPGTWSLHLADGRASDLYSLSTKQGSVAYLPITVKSFADVIQQVLVTKRSGMEDVALLTDAAEEPSQSMWSSLTSIFGSKTDKQAHAIASHPDDNKIHVFSLATGHMYERLLRIMMLSVSKRTSMPVKFWLFENYLSPTFKSIAATMAAKYGFEVAYVTYKWPEWLHAQTQKQRIIWGYKILFLDVLFPLHLKKIIYVDSDQVVRADLKELWEHDLQGAPYAYVPFCTSRQETLGFQFWRSGYWADHLRGKPYHISALYVVDLGAFRRKAVGDQLRATYDGLAKDPNSLSNLDQDLPNYAQHSVPIHSLPQDWLWCESWCSDESKAKAKTIDLCNNPLYKEPKLDMARRVISGSLFPESWVELDEEIARLTVD